MTRLRLLVHRYRRPLAAACAAACVLLLATVVRPAGPDLVPVVVASTDLPSGAPLGSGELAIAMIPVEHVPPGALAAVEAIAGRTLVGAIAAGEAITVTRLLEGSSDGRPTVPVRLADAEAAGLLVPGAVIDLVLPSGDGGGRIVAEGATVVTVPRRARESGLGAGPPTAGSLVVVATDRQTAVDLAAAGTRTGLGVVMR